MENQEQNDGQLKIELTPEVAEGIYANLAIITHSSAEVVMDFIRVLPGVPKANVKSRIIWLPNTQSACSLLFRTISRSMRRLLALLTFLVQQRLLRVAAQPLRLVCPRVTHDNPNIFSLKLSQ